MSSSKTRPDLREWRRQRAWELHQQGWLQKDIATALGVSTGAVSTWLKRGREGGVSALKTRPRSGRPPKLTAEQRAQIPELLARGAQVQGFRGDVWTATRIASVLFRRFGVRYHPDHVSRLLRQARWSPQQPVERATQRNEEALKTWHQERWPAIKKKRATKALPSSG